MALSIPPPARIAALKLFLLPEAEKLEFLSALENARPLANIVAFAEQLQTSIPQDDIIEFLRLIFGYYPFIDSSDEANGLAFSVAEDIYELWESNNEGSADHTLQEVFATFLQRVFAMEKSVGASAKGMWLMRQHERTFIKAEVFTDLRHVFLKQTPYELPEAGVIIHSLKVHYHQVNNESYRDLYIALDRDDLLQLRSAIDRALDKHSSLASLMEESEVADLLPIEDF